MFATTSADLNSSCGVSRRDFLTSLRGRALDTATAGVAALPLLPAAGTGMLLLGIGAQSTVVDALPTHALDEITQRNVDFTIPHANGGTIRVLGLHHATTAYERMKGSLDPKIATADIVLHELGEWFDTNIGAPARARHQKVGTIEGTFTQGKGALFFIGGVTYLAIKGYEQLKNAFLYATRAVIRTDREIASRRTVLANTAKMFGAICVSAPTLKIAADITGHPSLMAFDVSPLSDGRTIKMLDNAFVCAERYPGKRIAVVVGNAHAEAMKFYMEDPTNTKLFAAKSSIYKVLQLNAVDFRWRDRSTPGLL